MPALVQHFEAIAPPPLVGLVGSRVAAGVFLPSRPAVEAAVRTERVAVLHGGPLAHEPDAGSRSRGWAEPWEGVPSVARAVERDSVHGPLPIAAAAEDAMYAGAKGSTPAALHTAPHRGNMEKPNVHSGIDEARPLSRCPAVDSNRQRSDHVAAAASCIFPPRVRPAAAVPSAAAAAQAEATAVDTTAAARAGVSRVTHLQDAAYWKPRTADAQPEAGGMTTGLARAVAMAADDSERQRGEGVVRFSSEIDSHVSRVRSAATSEIAPSAAEDVAGDAGVSHLDGHAQLNTRDQPLTSQASDHVINNHCGSTLSRRAICADLVLTFIVKTYTCR